MVEDHGGGNSRSPAVVRARINRESVCFSAARRAGGHEERWRDEDTGPEERSGPFFARNRLEEAVSRSGRTAKCNHLRVACQKVSESCPFGVGHGNRRRGVFSVVASWLRMVSVWVSCDNFGSGLTVAKGPP